MSLVVGVSHPGLGVGVGVWGLGLKFIYIYMLPNRGKQKPEERGPVNPDNYTCVIFI